MFIADLHIHSKYSRATSRDCVPEMLDLWARKKGISLLGTGDFTHPAWREELKEKLELDQEGVYRLRKDARIPIHGALEGIEPRFVVSGEISSIYKKNGKVRKVHSLILLPSLEAAEQLSKRLEAIGNLHSDGRPILGLDCRDLLEITLESCPEALFIPAHIWTPHFALFGAFSGFDTIQECFEDLTPYIHALETGLSSDPAMNWRVSALDGYYLVSNSDAHSPQKLGREANLFRIPLSYSHLAAALNGENPRGLAGTIEFFPEEGKYHYDGHRNCNLCLSPSETEKLGGKCPVCGKKITIGVQHRVEDLADRPEGFQLTGARPFESLAPLPEVIAASTGCGSTSRKVGLEYDKMLECLGDEFSILRQLPLEEIGRVAGPLVQEGIRRLRCGQVKRKPGYDGEYGVIQLLDPFEMDMLNGQMRLFGVAEEKKEERRLYATDPVQEKKQETESRKELCEAVSPELLGGLNSRQIQAVTSSARQVAVIAGPGTGKTKTLVSRIVYLIRVCGVKPSQITAVTFTNQAAGELRSRLEKQLGGKRAARPITIGTFHAICLHQLEPKHLLDQEEAEKLAAEVICFQGLSVTPGSFLQQVSRWKNIGECSLPEEACSAYQTLLSQAGARDFDDLLVEALVLGKKKQDTKTPYLLVDEFQDVNPIQYQLVVQWSSGGSGLFVIGDPDQSIYGFRGSDAHCFEKLLEDFPETETISLIQNYRSTPQILQCALPMISKNPGPARLLEPQRADGMPVRAVTVSSALEEGIYVAKTINRMVGGLDMLDAQWMEGEEPPRSFSDIAVLYRTHRQAEMLERCLKKEGIPYVLSGREDALSLPTAQGTIGFFRFLLDSSDLLALQTALEKIWHCPADLIQSICDKVIRNVSISMEAQWKSLEEEYRQIANLQSFFSSLHEFLPLLEKESPLSLLNRWGGHMSLEQDLGLERLTHMAVFHPTIRSFVDTLLLGQEKDIQRAGTKEYVSGAVSLMTFHGAKGLEFPVTFLCGLEKGKVPLESSRYSSDPEEERRLFYVGMTRAREELFLLCGTDPSPFLTDIPEEFLLSSKANRTRQPLEGKQLSFF